MKVGRKPRAATRNLFLLKRKLFRKRTAATIILKKINRLAATMILKKKWIGSWKQEWAHWRRYEAEGNRIAFIDNWASFWWKRNKINQIIKNKEAKSGEIYWPQLRRAPIKFGRFIKLNNINVKFLYKQADIGFAAEAVFFLGGERGHFTQKKGVTLLPRDTDFREKNSPQAQYIF